MRVKNEKLQNLLKVLPELPGMSKTEQAAILLDEIKKEALRSKKEVKK